MIRPVLTEVLLFLLPFVGYALFLWLTRKSGAFDPKSWPVAHLSWLVLSALCLVLVSFVVLSHWKGAPPRSIYIPAHVENGKFVPGQTKRK